MLYFTRGYYFISSSMMICRARIKQYGWNDVAFVNHADFLTYCF